MINDKISEKIVDFAERGNVRRLHLFFILSVASTLSAIIVIHFSGSAIDVDWTDLGTLAIIFFVAFAFYGAIWDICKEYFSASLSSSGKIERCNWSPGRYGLDEVRRGYMKLAPETLDVQVGGGRYLKEMASSYFQMLQHMSNLLA